MKYTVENNLLKITVSSYGAELLSVINKKTGEEMMWQGDPEIWSGHCPMLFPYCGKFKNGSYKLDGKEYNVEKHGFIKDMEHDFVSAENGQLHFIATSNGETLKLFPRDFVFETIYTLCGNTLKYGVKITNKSKKELRFGLGFHPAFNIPFDKNHSTKDYDLQFDSPQTVVVKENYTSGPFEGLVSGEKSVLTNNSKVIELNDHMFDKDSLCLSELTSKTISLVEKDSGKNITVGIEGFPYVLLWSMFGTETLKFLCIEPWKTVQDTADATGNWNDKPCAAELLPNECWETEIYITFNR